MCIRDRYIIGPDVSPDSTDSYFLYYSPDAGTTLISRTTLWNDVTCIATDPTPGIIYAARFDDFHGPGIYFSSDSGRTWENRGDYYAYCLFSGSTVGEVIFSPSKISLDFGYTLRYGALVGVEEGDFELWRLSICGGTLPGEIYYISNSFNLLYSWCYADTYIDVNDFVGYITAGVFSGELWAYSPITDSLYYSADHGSTLTNLTPVPISEPESYELYDAWDFVRGYNKPGSLFLVRTKYYYFLEGGEITICHTENFGDTFVCITHNASGVDIEVVSDIVEVKMEPKKYSINAFPNPFNSTITIKTEPPSNIQIFNLKGNCVFETDEKITEIDWTPTILSAGIYIVKSVDSNQTRKILFVK